MNAEQIRKLLEDVAAGRTTVDAVLEAMRAAPIADLGFARVDTHRALRCGYPEVVFCQGKTPEQARKIARVLFDRCGRVLATRADVTVLAGEMLGEGLPVRLDWLEKWLERILRVGSIGQVETEVTIPGNSALQRAAAEVNISAAFRLVDRIREARRLLDGSSSPQLLIETLLLDFAVVFAPKEVNR